jgi:hypothetical protein
LHLAKNLLGLKLEFERFLASYRKSDESRKDTNEPGEVRECGTGVASPWDKAECSPWHKITQKPVDKATADYD